MDGPEVVLLILLFGGLVLLLAISAMRTGRD
jgi:hypothetical protein